MSTIFNPNIPTNEDTVYNAYFAFHSNMVSINNLIDVDHFAGTAPQFRGNHKQVTFPEPLDANPQPSGSIGFLYTGPSTAPGSSGAPILKYANRDGVWEIPLGKPSTRQRPKQEADPRALELPTQGPVFRDMGGGTTSGQGYARFDNHMAMVWFRTTLPKAGKGGEPSSWASIRFAYPLKFKTLFFATVNHGTSGFDRMDMGHVLPPNYTINIDGATVYNRNEDQSQSIQVLVIGETVS